MSKQLYPRAHISTATEQIENDLNESRYEINELIIMLEYNSVNRHYDSALKSICNSALLGLALMTIATLITSFLLTLLVCVDSHTWIYLNQRYVKNYYLSMIYFLRLSLILYKRITN